LNLKSSTIIHLWQTELWLFWHCVGSIYFLRRFISKPDIDISQDKSNETFDLFFTDSLFPGKARVLTFKGILNLKWALFFASNENHMRWMRGNYSSPPFIKLCWIKQPFNLSDCTIPHLGSQDEQQEILAMNKNCYFVRQSEENALWITLGKFKFANRKSGLAALNFGQHLFLFLHFEIH